MAAPDDRKDAAVYHAILAEMHRLRSLLLNLQTVDLGSTEEVVRAHLSREQSVVLGKLTEWRQHRPHIYRKAEEDFQRLYTSQETSRSG
jgi:hypothetical protein